MVPAGLASGIPAALCTQQKDRDVVGQPARLGTEGLALDLFEDLMRVVTVHAGQQGLQLGLVAEMRVALSEAVGVEQEYVAGFELGGDLREVRIGDAPRDGPWASSTLISPELRRRSGAGWPPEARVMLAPAA